MTNNNKRQEIEDFLELSLDDHFKEMRQEIARQSKKTPACTDCLEQYGTMSLCYCTEDLTTQS